MVNATKKGDTKLSAPGNKRARSWSLGETRLSRTATNEQGLDQHKQPYGLRPNVGSNKHGFKRWCRAALGHFRPLPLERKRPSRKYSDSGGFPLVSCLKANPKGYSQNPTHPHRSLTYWSPSRRTCPHRMKIMPNGTYQTTPRNTCETQL